MTNGRVMLHVAKAHGSVYLLYILLALLLVGCGGGQNYVARPVPYTPVPIIAGTSVTQPLSGMTGQTVPTGIDGAALVLPNGAAGTLAVAPIISGPAYPMGGAQGIQFRAPAGSHLQLQVTAPAGQSPCCFIFGRLEGCLDESNVPRTDRWVPVLNVTQAGNVFTFDLSTSVRGRQIEDPVDVAWGNPPTLDTFISSTRQYITTAIATLPEPERTQATTAFQGGMAPAFGSSSDAEGSYYVGYSGYDPTRAAPYFGFRLSAKDDIIAHETGHYLNHLLAGSTAFRPIIDLAQDENHGLGKYYPNRLSITDEYAYNVQYLLQGSVNGGDPTTGGWLGGIARKMPSEVDYPSLEGFGCSLMAALTRTTADTVPYFASYSTRMKTPMPAGALTKGEVLAVYASGAAKIDTLATALEKRMVEKNQGDAFRVIAERLGWSYRATGHILCNKLPVKGVTVTPFVKVTQNGVTTTYTTTPATTDVIGGFTLTRVFFGQGWLRLTYNSQTYDVPVLIDRKKSTIEYQTIPDIDIAIKPELRLTSITPLMGAMPDDTVTITGTNFGATQPTLGTVLMSPGYTHQRIEVQIVHWSDTAITVTVPFGLDMPSQVNVSRDGSNYSKTPLWFYPGDGSRYLNALKACTSIHVGDIGNTNSWFANKWGLSAGEIVLIRNYPASPWGNIVSNIQWNGNTFTGTMRGSGYWLEPDVADLGMASQTVTITGTVDPIRRCLLTLKADLRQTAAGNADAGFDSFDLMLSVSMKNLYGSDEANGIIPFGEGGGNWGTAGYPSTFPTTEANVVLYFDQRNGGEPLTVFPQGITGRIYVYFGHE